MKRLQIYGIMVLIMGLVLCSTVQIQAASKIEPTWHSIVENRGYVEEHPDDVEARFRLTVAYANLGYLEESFQQFEHLKESDGGRHAIGLIKKYELSYHQDPANLELMNYLAFAYFANDQFKESEVMFKKLVQLDPKSLWTYNYYALVQGNTGDYASAIETLKKAQKLQENKYTHFILSLAYYKNGQIFKSMYHLGKSGNVGLELLN